MSATTSCRTRPTATWSARRSRRDAIAGIDFDKARAAPGVLAIVTADNAGKLDKGKLNTAKLLGGPEIQHYHQAIAVVVAETFEQARAAAQLLRVDYVREQGAFDLASLLDNGKAQSRSPAVPAIRRSAISRRPLPRHRSGSMRVTARRMRRTR